MDKQSVTGFVLIALILVGYFFYTKPSEEEIARMQRERDSVAAVQAEEVERRRAAEFEERAATEVAGDGGALDSLFVQDSMVQQYHLRNDKLDLTVESMGAYISDAQIRGFKTWDGDSLRLFSGIGNGMVLNFFAKGVPVSTDQLNFSLQSSPEGAEAKVAGDTARMTLVAQMQEGAKVVMDYVLPYGSYMPSLSIRLDGMRKVLPSNSTSVDLLWSMRSPRQEKSMDREREYTKLAYQASNGDFEEMAATEDGESERVKTKIDWVGFKEQFFSAFLVNPEHFEFSDLSVRSLPGDEVIADFRASFMLPISAAPSTAYHFDFYMGPNLYKLLEAQGHGFEQVVPIGGWMIRWVNKYLVINVFDWLNTRIASYGIIILILTIMIKLLVFPLTYKSYKSQAKMRVLKPLVDEVNEKYPKKEDAMKKQSAVMALYRKAGVNPMGGCLPMLIQFPFLIAMFRFFPASFELRQKSFLWATDLSSYDSILPLPFNIPFYGDHVSLFTLLMAVAMYFSTAMNMKQSDAMNQQMPGMKYMMLYFMPLMMVIWFNSYSSGLSYYYFLAMCITIIQTLVIRRTIDEKKLFDRLKK
ncbi:MAG: membrane protein insertase YidC, partial [Bacteroidetes bacterium]